MRFRRPSPLLSILALIVFGCLVGLGVWQMQRLEWKRDLIAELSLRLEAEPLPLHVASADPQAADYRRVALTGRYLHDREMRVGSRVHRRQAGLGLVTPMVVSKGAARGRQVLIDRGWVPIARQGLAALPVERPEGEVTVQGWARAPRPPSGLAALLSPPDRPAERFWLRMDIEDMARTVGLNDVLPIYVQVAPPPGTAGTPPVAQAPRVSLENPHLNYAITWFGLAAALVVMFAIYHARRGSRDRASEKEAGP